MYHNTKTVPLNSHDTILGLLILMDSFQHSEINSSRLKYSRIKPKSLDILSIFHKFNFNDDSLPYSELFIYAKFYNVTEVFWRGKQTFIAQTTPNVLSERTYKKYAILELVPS